MIQRTVIQKENKYREVEIFRGTACTNLIDGDDGSPVVLIGLTNDDDAASIPYGATLSDWTTVNAVIDSIRSAAHDAFGPDVKSN